MVLESGGWGKLMGGSSGTWQHCCRGWGWAPRGGSVKSMSSFHPDRPGQWVVVKGASASLLQPPPPQSLGLSASLLDDWHLPLGLGAQLVPCFLLPPRLPPTLCGLCPSPMPASCRLRQPTTFSQPFHLTLVLF